MTSTEPTRHAHSVDPSDEFAHWPNEFAERYRAAGWWSDRTLGQELGVWARSRGEHPAIVAGEERLTYAALDERADVIANRLRRSGLHPGDTVVLQLPNSAEFVTVLFGLLRLGVRPVIALAAHRRSEIEYFCQLTDATAYICTDTLDGYDFRTLADEISAAAPTVGTVLVVGDPGRHQRLDTGPAQAGEVTVTVTEPADPDAVALFLLSGGTTGRPKLVPRTHNDWSYSGRAMAEAIPYDTTTVTLVSLSIGHNWPLTHGMLATFHAGGTLVVATSPDPAECFELVERERVTDTGLVPGTALLWMDEAPSTSADLSSLRRVAIGGNKLDAELASEVEPALGVRLQQMFGMAEGLIGFVRDGDPEEMKIRSQGRPVSPGDELRVVDAADQEVAEGEIGELLTRGPYTIRGYHRAPEHNQQSFTVDGFYRTGDLVRLLRGGFVEFTGRIKDQINRGGEKIAAPELENHLVAHPAIRQAAVVGIADTVLGEACCAYIVPTNGEPTLAELREFLIARGVATYKLPDRCHTLAAFPLTPLGKVDKRALAAQTELPRR